MHEATHVVVVDDHNDIRDLVREYLEHQGYKVSVAEGGQPYDESSRDRRST